MSSMFSNRGSESEGVNSLIGTDIEPILGGDECLEVMQSCHRRPRATIEKRLTVVAPKPVEPIITFGPDHPYNWFGLPIGRRDDWGTCPRDSAAPCRRNLRVRAATDLQHRQFTVQYPRWASLAATLKGALTTARRT